MPRTSVLSSRRVRSVLFSSAAGLRVLSPSFVKERRADSGVFRSTKRAIQQSMRFLSMDGSETSGHRSASAIDDSWTPTDATANVQLPLIVSRLQGQTDREVGTQSHRSWKARQRGCQSKQEATLMLASPAPFHSMATATRASAILRRRPHPTGMPELETEKLGYASNIGVEHAHCNSLFLVVFAFLAWRSIGCRGRPKG
jgi:hypothetical protein